jgi:hypothetical protein
LGAWNVGITGNYKLLSSSQALAGAPVVSTFFQTASGGRLFYRGRLGWAGTEGAAQGLSITGFVNFISHSANNPTTMGSSTTTPPACYWAVGFSAGSCYPGSPHWGPYTVFRNFAPGLYTFDMSFGYQSGTKPANEYLQNVNFQLTVNDLLNKAPPFEYSTQSTRGTAAFVTEISPLQRFIAFTVTKAW